MSIFPSEFLHAIHPVRTPPPVIRGDAHRLRWFPSLIRPEVRTEALALLETRMAPHLRPASRPIDPATIAGMKKNYSEALPKSLRNATVLLNDSRSAASQTARAIGLTRHDIGGAPCHLQTERTFE